MISSALLKRISILTVLTFALAIVSSNFSTRAYAMPSCGGNDPSAFYDARLAMCLAACQPSDAVCNTVCYVQNIDLIQTTPCDTGGNNFGGLGGTFEGSGAGAGQPANNVALQCTYNQGTGQYENCGYVVSVTPTPAPIPGSTPLPPITKCPDGSITTLGTCNPIDFPN